MADIEITRYTVISFPDNEDIDDITTGIVEGSLLLDEILFSGDIKYGEVNANRFEASVYGLDDVAGEKIQVYQVDGSSIEYIFTGYIDSCVLDDFGNYRNIVAYDVFYKCTTIQYDIAHWWSDYWQSLTTSTLGELLRDLLDSFNLPYIDVTLPFDNLQITQVQQIQQMSLADMLSQICELNTCIPNVNRQGYIEFIFLRNPTEISISDAYERGNSTFEAYTVKAVNRIEIYDESDNLLGGYGTGSNVYDVHNNMFMYERIQFDGETTAYEMYHHINTLQYRPCEINMIVSDSSIKLGDVITTIRGSSIVSAQTLHGSLLIEQTITSTGSQVKPQTSYSPTAQRLGLQLEQLTQAFENKVGVYILYENKDGYEITNTDTEIINIPFHTNKESFLVFHVDIIFTIETDSSEVSNVMQFNDGEVQFHFYLNNEEILDYAPKETLQDGVHTIHLGYSWYNEIKNETLDQSFVVVCEVDACEVTIPAFRIHGYLTGDGLYIGSGWDGRIIAEDEFENIELDMTPSIRDTYDVTLRNENMRTYTQILSNISLDGIVPTITDSIGQLLGMIFSTIVNVNLLSYTATISDDTFIAGEIITPKIHNINSVSVISQGDVSFAVSFDSGTTWNEYANGQWVPGATMTKAEIESVPNSAWVGDAMIKAIIADDDISNLTQIVIEGGILV